MPLALKQLVAAIRALSLADFCQVAATVVERQTQQVADLAVRAQASKVRQCPHCQSRVLAKWGLDRKGLPRGLLGLTLPRSAGAHAGHANFGGAVTPAWEWRDSRSSSRSQKSCLAIPDRLLQGDISVSCQIAWHSAPGQKMPTNASIEMSLIEYGALT